LPFRLPTTRTEDARRIAREIRDLRFNPQRHLADGALRDPRAKQLAAEKQAWINQHPEDQAARRARFQRLKSLTEQLETFTGAKQQAIQGELVQRERELKKTAILTRRDYP